MSTPFIEDNDQTRARREHLESLREMVGNAYPNKFERSRITGSEDTITSIVERYGALEPQAKEGQRPVPEEIERANAELNKIEVRVAGRISTPPRVMGKAAFVHLSDGQERLQIYVRKADVKGVRNDDLSPIEEGWELFHLLDHGDFIGVAGFLFVTKTGELSIHVRDLQFLAKALLPMPDKMHGISDPEIRQRQRYADLIAGSLKVKTEDDADKDELSPREVFQRRSKLITEMRRFLDDHDYIEVETPMLTPKATGAVAKPFETHHNALDIKLYARIAPELYLKRLVVGGFERIYELNRNFRNEGISTRHNPEFTMLEFYCAYMDVNGMMDFCEEMLQATLKAILDTTSIPFSEGPVRFRKEDGTFSTAVFDSNAEGTAKGIKLEPLRRVLDFGPPFARLSMKEAILKYWRKHYEFSFSEVENAEGEMELSWLDDPKRVRLLYEFRNRYEFYQPTAEEQVEELGLDLDKNQHLVTFHVWKQVNKDYSNLTNEPREDETARQIAYLFEDIAEKHLKNPTFIINFPKSISPLSKASPTNPAIAERFELYVAGMEIANGFSELNDPVEQRERFLEQMQQRERGDEEAMVLDEDYIRALSYGMPPAAGIGIGIDRLVMLLTNKRSIRDVILFPHMRPERKRDEQENDETN